MVARGEAEHPRRGLHEAEAAVVHAVTQLWRSGLAVIDRRITHVGSVMGAVAMALVLVPQDTRIGAHAQTLPVSGNVEPAKGSPSLVTDGGLGTDLPRPTDSASGSGEPPKLPEGLPGVLPDQPSAEGETTAEGGEGEPPLPDGSQTAGGGVVEPPVSESTPEPQVARLPVVRRTEVSREQVNEYPEGRADGSTVNVKVFRVTFSDGKTEDRYEVSQPAGSAPPPPPPAARPGQQEAPPPASNGQTARASQIEASSYTDRGPARKSFPPDSKKGEGIYDSPEFVDPPLKSIFGHIVKTVRLPNRHLGIIVRVHGQEIKLEYITLDVANSVKKPKEVRPTLMSFQNQSDGTTKAVPTPELSHAEARLEKDDAVWINVTASWFDRSIHGFGAPVRAIWFTGS